ncbi:uncharacterized protein LOC117169505 [Belonocnema kinseyi]|uniref:uncharacterized protein LOC117169505 n=1 Tax=Belonocnema kinseyi TaxID=2817044 RepID=UPI00143D9F24|nr:uncharacterized protein LOC117169505 [Belonocnema kinseyi]XP_033211806.1 uncharacterized protein LOC117169505 [Belonocnema kinseyi]
MVSHVNDFGSTKKSAGLPEYAKPIEDHLTLFIQIIGICTAIVVSGVGVDVAYHGHVMGFYVTGASVVIFFLEVTWAITLFIQICVKNDESLCWNCWSSVLMITRGWRRSLFYLPVSCILAWKPYRLWLSFVAAGLLAILALAHIASSALDRRSFCQMNGGVDQIGESLLHTRPDCYDHFEEVLVTEVLDDGSGAQGRYVDSDGEI